LQCAGKELKQLSPDLCGKLLTQDTYLAVESGLTLPPGLEMGPFSYFPEWDREKAEACHVMNREMLRELIRTTDAPVAAFSGWALRIAAPSIERITQSEREELRQLIESRYAPIDRIENFGHAATTLEIMKLKQ